MTAGLRERNKLRRREQITDAALRLFAEHGFDGATIDDIAAAADVSRRTFFRYFARKEDVLLAWKRHTAEELREALDARPASEASLDAVHGALATVAAGYAARPDLTIGLMRLFESGPALHPSSDYQAWDEVIAEGLALRLGVDPLNDPEPRLVATVGFAVFAATVQSWGAIGGKGDLIALLDDGFAALRRATAKQPAKRPTRRATVKPPAGTSAKGPAKRANARRPVARARAKRAAAQPH